MTREAFWDYFPFMFNTAATFAALLVHPRISTSKTLKGRWAWVARAVTLVLLGAVCFYGWYLGKLQRDLFGS